MKSANAEVSSTTWAGVKYGALSVPGGRVTIQWHLTESPTGWKVVLEWKESGGPVIDTPIKSSLGTELIEGFITYDLNGKCNLNYTPQGVAHSFEFHVSNPKPTAAA